MVNFAPYVYGLNELKPPPGLLVAFDTIASKVYPQNIIAKLRRNSYNPVIIGYTHDKDNFLEICMQFTELAASTPKQLKVALEIVPEQLGWIVEFLRDEKEYKEQGTVWGKKPTEEMVRNLNSYRVKLSQNNSQRLVLWLLENGFEVVSMEHEKVLDWIDSDRKRMCSDDFFDMSELQPGYTAIRRDIHGLGVIEKGHPDIISVGFYHALKYDLLLKRDGRNSFYFITGNFSWSALLNVWEQAHALYLPYRQPPTK